MRILQISSARAIGGGERHVADLANALARRGHEVHAAVAPRSPLREELRGLRRESVHELRMRNALDLSGAVRLARLVREHRIDVVHAHMARDYPLAALATRRARNTRLIITRHVLFPLSRIHTLTLSQVSRVIAVSEAVARALRAQAIFPAQKIVTVPNGVDMRRFRESERAPHRAEFRKSLKVGEERVLVGTVGEIRPLKGQEEFLRAASIVARENEKADFVIAGQDTSHSGENRAAVERLVGELALRGRVRLTGWVENVAPFLHSLDVFVSPSRSESFGLSIVEAMACGLPVVTTATEGASEIIEDGADGLLVPVGNIDALASAINTLIRDEATRRRLGEHAARTARDRFSLERMVEEIERVYEEKDEG